MSDASAKIPGAEAPKWSSRFAFLMASIGVAVGLGNLWRFPFQTGQNGGSAFVIVYLICVALIAWPILIGELSIGRHKGLSAVGSARELARDVGASPNWGVIGWLGAIGGFLVLTTYGVIAGQIMAYSVMSFMGTFADHTGDSALPLFNGTVHSIVWFSLFLILTVGTVAGGLREGIERLVTSVMPLFFVLLLVLSIYALSTGAAGRTFEYLFSPRFDELNPQVVLAALGQAFYSVAVGTAGLITYGAFLDRKENIAENAGYIAGADTIVALVAGLMIFPIVFSAGLDPAAGMGLIFQALPFTFSGMPAGAIIGGLFFFMAFVAALTSAISMLFVPTMIIEEKTGMGRAKTAMLIGLAAWLIGLVGLAVHGMAEAIDFTVGSIVLPVAALLGAVFVGWVVPRDIMRDELHNASPGLFRIWRFLIRWLAPIAVTSILVFGLISATH